jgi:hypothetical protein
LNEAIELTDPSGRLGLDSSAFSLDEILERTAPDKENNPRNKA